MLTKMFDILYEFLNSERWQNGAKTCPTSGTTVIRTYCVTRGNRRKITYQVLLYLLFEVVHTRKKTPMKSCVVW